MKNLLFYYILLSSITIYAQDEYNYNSDWVVASVNIWPVYIPQDSVAQKIEFEIQRKKKTEKLYKTFDANGHLLDYVTLDKNNVERPWVRLRYDNKGNLIETYVYKRKKLKYKRVASFNENNKPVEEITTNKKGNISNRKTWYYRNGLCQDSSFYYKGTNTVPHYMWVYKYYNDCSKEKSLLYKKGKLKNTWSFDCKQEGEKLEKKKNTTQVCRWEKTSADTITKVEQLFNEKGKMEKHVFKYTAADTLPLAWLVYNEREELKRRTLYDKSFDRHLKYEFYRKGKAWITREYTYSNNLLIKEIIFDKNKITETFLYEYDNKGKVVVVKRNSKYKYLNYTTRLNYTLM